MGLLTLRGIESRAWRADQQDGLFDLFFAVLFLGIACSQAADALWGNDLVTMGVLVALQFGGAAGLWWARRKITRPRLGVVRFGLGRKRRIRTSRIVLAVCVAVTLAIVALTLLGNRAGVHPSVVVSRVTVSAIAAVLVLIPLALIAYFQEFPRILVHGVLFAAGEFGGTWLEEAALPFARTISFGGAALISALLGAVLLTWFLRMTRTRPVEGEPGGSDDA